MDRQTSSVSKVQRTRQGGRQAARVRQTKRSDFRPFTYGQQAQDVMTPAAADELFAKAEQVLSEIGIAIGNWPFSKLGHPLPKGCHHKDGKLFFERGVAREILVNAPSEFKVHARNSRKSVWVGGCHGVFAAGQGAFAVSGFDFERRAPKLKDIENFVKLSQTATAIQITSGLCQEISDISNCANHLELTKLYFTLSDQVFLSPARSADEVIDLMQVADLAFGGDANRHPFMFGPLHWNRAFMFDSEMLDLLFAYGENGQAVILSPIMTLGATAPASLDAALVQWLAEIMAAACVSQILKPGLPILVGGMFTSLAMKYGTPKFTGPEISQMTHAAAQLARLLNIPFWSGAGLTSAKILDAQAGSECQLHLDDIGFSQAQMASGSFGTLEAGQVADLEKFMLDVHLLEMMQATQQTEGLDLSCHTETVFSDMHGRSFMGHPHTQEITGELSAQNPVYNDDLYELWQAGGAEDMKHRAQRVAQTWLSGFDKPDFDPAIERDMRAFIDQRADRTPVSKFPSAGRHLKLHMHTNIQADIASLLHDDIWDGMFKRR